MLHSWLLLFFLCRKKFVILAGKEQHLNWLPAKFYRVHARKVFVLDEDTVKQDMFTAIKVWEFHLSDMYKEIIIHVFLFPTSILMYKKYNFQSRNFHGSDHSHEDRENKLLVKFSYLTATNLFILCIFHRFKIRVTYSVQLAIIAHVKNCSFHLQRVQSRFMSSHLPLSRHDGEPYPLSAFPIA